MADYLSPLIGDGSGSSLEAAKSFIRVAMSGTGPLARRLEEAAGAASEKELRAAVRKGANVIAAAYKQKLPADVTGNLRKSVDRKDKAYASGVVVGVVGPRHVVAGSDWDVETKGAGNHAWLVEFGTQRRRPGTKNRRTYINVHRMINKRAVHSGGMNDEEFQNASRGYYFIMSSKEEPTRKKRAGSGYPHDFIMTLHPGETYGGMPASNAMQKAIESSGGNARAALESSIAASLKKFTN